MISRSYTKPKNSIFTQFTQEERDQILSEKKLKSMVQANPEPQAPTGYKILKEGKANLLYIEEHMEKDDMNRVKNAAGGKRQANEVNETRGAVFYNPVQEFNRDTSILVINEFNEVLREERLAK